jgi:AraC family transcriptional regulator
MFDQASESAILQCHLRSPVLSNYHSGTQIEQEGICASYHRQPAWSTPKTCLSFPTIRINMRKQFIHLERSLDGYRNSQQRIFDQDIVVIPADVTCQARWDREIEFMMLILSPEAIAHVAYESVDPDSVDLLPHFDTSDPIIHQIGLSFKAELESGQWNRLAVDSLRTILSTVLLRKYSNYKGKLHNDTGGLSKCKLVQATSYINDNLSEDLSLSAIATELGMSLHYFSTLFKKSTGTTVHQYVTQRRMKVAKGLLERSNLSIIEIAFQVGFQSQSHFHNVFRKYTDTTPNAYRKASH